MAKTSASTPTDDGWSKAAAARHAEAAATRVPLATNRPAARAAAAAARQDASAANAASAERRRLRSRTSPTPLKGSAITSEVTDCGKGVDILDRLLSQNGYGWDVRDSRSLLKQCIEAGSRPDPQSRPPYFILAVLEQFFNCVLGPPPPEGPGGGSGLPFVLRESEAFGRFQTESGGNFVFNFCFGIKRS